MTATHFPAGISPHRRRPPREIAPDAIRTSERFDFRSERQLRKSFVTARQVLRGGLTKPGCIVRTRPRGAVVNHLGNLRRRHPDYETISTECRQVPDPAQYSRKASSCSRAATWPHPVFRTRLPSTVQLILQRTKVLFRCRTHDSEDAICSPRSC